MSEGELLALEHHLADPVGVAGILNAVDHDLAHGILPVFHFAPRLKEDRHSKTH
jgi:hypothetical protein